MSLDIHQMARERERSLANAVIETLYWDEQPTLPSRDEIHSEVLRLLETPKFRPLGTSRADVITNGIVSERQITKPDPRVITGKEAPFEQWFPRFRDETPWLYYRSYHDFLWNNPGIPQKAVQQNDKETDLILSHCENPQKSGTWIRKGMVVGHVQSGKTANYIGLLAKAADAGYKFIIILTGTLNDLRRQTQIRIDRWVGYHKNSVKYGPLYPTRWTTDEKDFNKNSVDSHSTSIDALNTPIILAIKKNTSTLKELYLSLKRNSVPSGKKHISHPLLIIDDEADYASVNTNTLKEDEDPTAINKGIRKILGLFERRTYVGYTATPFANIFIDPESTSRDFQDDLFPKDFILNLQAPSNYFGPDFIFRQQNTQDDEEKSQSPFIRTIENPADPTLPIGHKSDFCPRGLRDDLVEALRTFLIALTIRKSVESSGFHASMLVHASRFTSVQRRLAEEIESEKKLMEEAFEVHGMTPEPEALNDDIVHAFRDTFRREYEGHPDVPDWETIQQGLAGTIRRTVVRAINVGSKEKLDYEKHPRGLHVIAVGGNSLSRGLTLDGLIVSYFLRNARAYDTLMQMGRWFGYRDGYMHLCRIWLTAETTGAFEHVTESMLELRGDIDELVRLDLSPQDFALRVRSHPDNLLTITAPNKMGNTIEHDISLSNRFIETHILEDTPIARAANLHAAKLLAETLQQHGQAPKVPQHEQAPESPPYGWFYTGVNVDIIDDFLARYKNSEYCFRTDYGPVSEFIGIANKHKQLLEWDVYFPSLAPAGADSRRDEHTLAPSLSIVFQHRSRGASENTPPRSVLVGKKGRVSSRGIEKIGLSKIAIERVEQDHRADPETTPDKRGAFNYPDLKYRDVRLRPLLVVHLLNLPPNGLGNEPKLNPDGLHVAWSISFPKSTNKKFIQSRYRVNARLAAIANGEANDEDADD